MTDLGPLVRLGDVRQWLRAGDRFVAPRIHETREWTVETVGENGIDAQRYKFRDGAQLHLISPRWERVNIGDTMLTGTVVTNGHAVWETSGTLISGTSYRLVRTGVHAQSLTELIEQQTKPLTEQQFAKLYKEPVTTTALSAPTGWHPNGVSVTTDPRADLREEFRFTADRVDWELVAEIHRQRGMVGWCSRSVELRATADHCLENALEATDEPRAVFAYAPASCGILIDLTSGVPALYLEALNAAAYHAKCEELWPKRVETEKHCRYCSCGSEIRCGSHRSCGDCMMTLDRMARTDAPEHRAEGRFRVVGLAPDPLTPSARYHLADDTGWSTPGWEA